MAEGETKKKHGVPGKVLGAIVVVVLVAAVAASVYFYKQYQKSQQLLQNPNLAAQQQTSALLAQVSKLIELPKDETPTIATVSDVSKLQGQPFFDNAKNGDKVIIYTKNKKAILYDPTQNIIVEVAPVNIGNAVPTPSVTVQPTPTVKPTLKATKATPTPVK